MDRIRQALDRARDERKKAEGMSGGTAPPLREHVGGFAVGNTYDALAATGSLQATVAPFAYTRTRVFTPSADALEANRILNPASNDPAAGAFRMLRTQILHRLYPKDWRSVAVFSPTASDGKSTTAINLAVSLANDHRHSVLLVDFDFRRPSLAKRLGLAPEYGSDDALTGSAAIEDCLYHPAGFERFVVMPARNTLMNSSEVLASPRTRDVVAELRGRYPDRIVLFDLPPVLSADDALAFAPVVDCGLVVIAESRTRRDDLTRTMELLHKTPIVGTVLNEASIASASSY